MNAKVPKFSWNPVKMLPRTSQILPKSNPDGTGSPLGDYVGPLMEKNWVFHYQKVAQRHPRAPKRGQKMVKFQVNKYLFLVFFSKLFCKEFWYDFSRLQIWKMWLPSRRNTIFWEIDVLAKSSKKHRFGDNFREKNTLKNAKNVEIVWIGWATVFGT